MNDWFLKILTIFISILDYPNKKKVINCLKKKITNKKNIFIDIGAHKGETIDLLNKNFQINKIYSFEPNNELFFELKKKYKYYKNIRLFNNGVGLKKKKMILNIMQDSSSSTINELNTESTYFSRKKKIISFFSKKKNFFKKIIEIQVVNLSNFIKKEKIYKIDLLKIDTEGYEYNILSGLDKNDFTKINYIYFEHHYDLMVNKAYNFRDINDLLKRNNFIKIFKTRMVFRKSFEYIYENTKKIS